MLVVTHKLASAFVAFVNCKQTWRPFHPKQAIAIFLLLFLALNAPYEELFRQLCLLINNRAAHLGQLFLGREALERRSPRQIHQPPTLTSSSSLNTPPSTLPWPFISCQPPTLTSSSSLNTPPSTLPWPFISHQPPTLTSSSSLNTSPSIFPWPFISRQPPTLTSSSSLNTTPFTLHTCLNNLSLLFLSSTQRSLTPHITAGPPILPPLSCRVSQHQEENSMDTISLLKNLALQSTAGNHWITLNL
ncbi:hypothetical protein E2C01_031927 [Portunus trituberculatus]|uniref:Uncharacterized protein n=1 Tax=Portunus trituberculatus TaxID=210409 RepID=A0A5B7EUQ7_PORTR|nr:hypothetical protein [Portunus trituberculatus]